MRESLYDIGKRLLTLLVIFALITYGLAALQRWVSEELFRKEMGGATVFCVLSDEMRSLLTEEELLQK